MTLATEAADTLRAWTAVRRSCCSSSSASGVFLAGLELMITAVALPSILADLVDANRTVRLDRAAQGELDHQRLSARLHPRRCRWPAGWPTSGAPGGCSSAALAIFIVGSRAGRAWPRPRPAHRGAARPGGRRRRPRAGRHGGRGAPVRGRGAAAGARRHRRPDVPGHGRRAVRWARRSSAPSHPEGRSPRPALAGTPLGRRPRPGVALGLLLQRADRHRRRCSSPGRRRPAGTRRAGGPGRRRRGGAVRASRWRPGSVGADAARARPRSPATDLDPPARHRRPRRSWRSSATLVTIVRGLRGHDPFLDPGCSGAGPFSVGGARLAADRLRVRDRDHRRGGVRRPACCTAARTSSGWPSVRWRARPRSARSSRGFAVRVPVRSRIVTLVGLARAVARPRRDGRAGRPTTDIREVAARRWRVFGLGLRADGHAALDGRGRGGRSGGVRDGIGGRHGRADGRAWRSGSPS